MPLPALAVAAGASALDDDRAIPERHPTILVSARPIVIGVVALLFVVLGLRALPAAAARVDTVMQTVQSR